MHSLWALCSLFPTPLNAQIRDRAVGEGRLFVSPWQLLVLDFPDVLQFKCVHDLGVPVSAEPVSL